MISSATKELFFLYIITDRLARGVIRLGFGLIQSIQLGLAPPSLSAWNGGGEVKAIDLLKTCSMTNQNMGPMRSERLLSADVTFYD